LAREFGQEAGEDFFGETDRGVVQNEHRVAVRRAQSRGGQDRDPCEVLAEQQENGSGGTDVQGQVGVGQALLEEFPGGVVVDSDGIGLEPVRDEKRAAAAGGPDDEVADPAGSVPVPHTPRWGCTGRWTRRSAYPGGRPAHPGCARSGYRSR